MPTITFHPAGTPTSKAEHAITALYALIERGHSLCMTASGKDSTVATILTLEAIRRANSAQVVQAPHYVLSADTRVENPSMAQHITGFLDEISSYCEKNGLNVSTHIATPALASQFVVSTPGRGTLPRTVYNSVKEGKGVRPCSDDWKVRPQKRLKERLHQLTAQQGYLPPISILGTRYSESSARQANMQRRGETAHSVLAGEDGDLTFSPIAEWDTDDVWWLLSQFTSDELAPFPAPVSTHCINRLHELYRDANEGTCGVVLGEAGHRKACGSRFGCAICLVAGDKDSSMEAMLTESRYKHLQGLNQFRNYLLATQWDLSLREIVGRTLSPAGYLKIQADVYSFEHRIELVKILLTLDAIEAERAEHIAEGIACGHLENSQENRELAEPQFELITPQQLVAIDFYLGMHHECPHAFPAVCLWYEVRKLGRRFPIPEVANPVPKQAIPVHGWLKVGSFDFEVPTDGLRSYKDEMWNRHRHPGRASTHAQTPTGEVTCYFEENQSFDIDEVDACAFVTCTFDSGMHIEARSYSGLESTRFYLNEALIKLPKGMSGKYHLMAKREQYFYNLRSKFNMTNREFNDYLISKCISSHEHDTLMNPQRISPQFDLFQY